MLNSSNLDIPSTLSIFKNEDLQVSFLVPTKTGMRKSIMDSTQQHRSFLFDAGLHDFDKQKKGPPNKKIVETLLSSNDTFFQTKTSLYRPITKEGDPRIWVYGLKKHASFGDLLAFLSAGNRLIVVNCTTTSNLLNLLKTIKLRNPKILTFKASLDADELLDKIRKISGLGYIPTLKRGDTGVGFTLESLLGITANSSRTPDYKGIEIKSSRKRNARGNLFGKVPNWDLSRIKSAKDLVTLRGIRNSKHNNFKTLCQTIKGDKTNKNGFRLKIDDSFIYQTFTTNALEEKDTCWALADFEAAMLAKHKETFWVDVETRITSGFEEFHYKKIIHTGGVDLLSIPFLIDSGVISLDYSLWEKRDGWKKWRGKNGFDFNWKITKKNRDLLFKFAREYEL